MKTIGILGGMGPEATADLYMRIIRIFQREYGAAYDKDFPPIIVYSLPIPDVVEGLESEKPLIDTLQGGVKKLEEAGADFIVIACNTVHVYLPRMQEAVSIPILGIPLETIREVQKVGCNKIGLLGTEMTLEKGLFEAECSECGIELLKPTVEERKMLTSVIMNVLMGKKTETDKQTLLQLTEALRRKGAGGVILGCTDLPILLRQEDCSIRLFDTTQVLARAAVNACRENE